MWHGSFFMAINNNTVKQYLKIAVVLPFYLSGSMMLQLNVKYFNF